MTIRSLVAAAALCLVPLVARAQAPTPPPAAAEDPALAQAKIHFQQGVALFNDGNFGGALAEFEAAYKVRSSPGVLYNIGLTQKALFRYSDAIASLERYKNEEQKITPERRAEVEQLVREMRALLADVTLNIEPAGSTVLVDGRTLGQSPFDKPLGIAAGNHVVEVQHEGYKPARREVMISAGVPLTLTIKLEFIPKTAKVRIQVKQEGALVKVDERVLGFAPQDTELGAGGHHLEISLPKFQTHRSEIIIAAGQARTVDVSLDPVAKKFYQQWWFWTPITLIVAGGAAAAIAVPLTTPQDPLVGTLGTGVGKVN
jgi:hypothetical protein